MSELFSTYCACDLRHRRWNPNTGCCETCRCKYDVVKSHEERSRLIANDRGNENFRGRQ